MGDEPKLQSIDDLQPASYNPRKIGPYQQAALAESLKTFGDISGIVWNATTGNLVCGHQRVDQLRKLGAQLVNGALQIANGERFPVRIVAMSEAEEKAANVTANNPHISGEFDDGLHAVLEDVKSSIGEDEFQELALDALLEDAAKNLQKHQVEEDEVPEPPKVPVTKPGDVWSLGDHTLVSADCSIIKIPMYDLLVTDPPYGVSYADKNEFLNSIYKGNRCEQPIVSDHMKPEEMSEFWKRCFGSVRNFAKPGASYYVTGPQGGDLLFLFLLALKESGFPLRHMLIWAKNNHVLGRSDYNYKHEPILFGWVKGTHTFVGEGDENTSLWQVDRPLASELHPTMKPVALFAKAIGNSSRSGGLVVDPFAGSGTTLIAAEQLGRRCHAIEIEPAYCDIIVERWEQLTGGKAKRVTG